VTDETGKITPNKTVSKDLTASETRYRRLFEAARDGILLLDAVSSKITDVNPFMVEFLGYSREEFLGRELWEIGLFRDKDESQTAFRALQETGYIRYENIPLRTKAGHQWDVEFISNVYAENDQHVIQCNIRDITERKRLERARRESDENLTQLVNNITDAFWIRSPDLRKLIYISPAFERIWGRSTDSLYANPHQWGDFILPEDRERVSAAFATLTDAAPSIELEYRIVWPDGQVRWVYARGFQVRDAVGALIRLTGVVTDITERKAAEAALQESEQLYRQIVETAGEGIWLIDLEGKIQFSNQQTAKMLGYSVEEMKGRSAFDFLFQEDLDEAQQRFAKCKEGTITRAEFRARHIDGSELQILGSSTPVRNKDREVRGLLVMLSDITEQKRADAQTAHLTAEIEEQQERLRSIVANVPGIVWESWWTEESLSQRSGFVNDYVVTMLGYSVEEWRSRPDFWLSVVYEEDRERAQLESSKIISSEEGGSLEYRMLTKAGSIIWAETRIAIIKVEGRPLGLRGVTIDITERKHSEAALKESEANYRTLIESSPAIIYLAHPFPPYSPIYVSPNIKAFGYSVDEWFSRPDMWGELIHKEDRERVMRTTEEALSQGLETELEYRVITRDGQVRWLQDKGRLIADRRGNKSGWQGVIIDITKTKELESQLRQSQKLESVGLLAGGIAHDFNNMLTAINGYSDLTLRRLKDDDPLRHNIEEIKKAGERSAELTHQLLAFSRQQILQPKLLSLNRVITDMSKMLERLIGEDIQLNMVLNYKAGQVKVDPGQLSQIIMNLAINARDAMPLGGKLTFETDNVTFDGEYARHHVSTIPGDYVLMSVSDTGTGMNADTQAHIFEPFFTTKEAGQGTGLGLATVYGIVKQSGGNIWVYSEEGVGTTFKVYFPRVIEKSEAEAAKNTPEESPGGTETILLVEDEEMVRMLARRILEECGYTVLEAGNGAQALALCDKHEGHIDMLMTDVVMPHMGGREVAERMAQMYPEMRILFTSGYTDDAVVRHGVIETGMNFIQKPFTLDALARKIREVLDAPPSAIQQ